MTRAEELARLLMLCPMIAEGICAMRPDEWAMIAAQAQSVLKKDKAQATGGLSL